MSVSFEPLEMVIGDVQGKELLASRVEPTKPTEPVLGSAQEQESREELTVGQLKFEGMPAMP